MKPTRVRCLCAALSIALGAVLLLSAYCLSRFAVRDLDFVLRGPLMEPWAQTWLWRGDSARFAALDTDRAVDAYWRGAGRNPLLLDAWFALARLERRLDAGPRSDALRDFLLAHVPVSTSWGWQRFLLASEGRGEARLAQSFNFVLRRLAAYRQEAVEVALGVWGGWPAILERADCDNRWAVLEECMARGLVDACLGLHPLLETGGCASPDPSREADFIDFLLRAERWDDAVAVGRRGGLLRDGVLADARLAEPFTGKAFDWRLSKAEGVEAMPEPRDQTGTGRVMRFRFLGTTNLNFAHFWRYAPLRPGSTYELRFAWKALRLTTDQGMYVEVRGVDCGGLAARGPAITGSRDWSGESLVFDVPDECRMAKITLRRNESLKFDSRIRGDVWIDGLELVERRAGEL